MKFENRTTDMTISALARKASALLEVDSPLMDDIRQKNDFKYNSKSGLDVCLKFYSCKKVAPIFFYRPLNPFTKALGYSDGKAIHLNIKKFSSLNEAQIIGLLCHEYAHIAGFSHGNNYKTEEKCLFSVPYWISENINKYLN